MQEISLNGSWTLQIPDSEYPEVPATVPGSVYNDLLANKLMEDPYYRDNENNALALMENDFHYSRSFAVDAAMLENDAVLLYCEGLDTFATVLLNGQQVGTAGEDAELVPRGFQLPQVLRHVGLQGDVVGVFAV